MLLSRTKFYYIQHFDEIERECWNGKWMVFGYILRAEIVVSTRPPWQHMTALVFDQYDDASCVKMESFEIHGRSLAKRLSVNHNVQEIINASCVINVVQTTVPPWGWPKKAGIHRCDATTHRSQRGGFRLCIVIEPHRSPFVCENRQFGWRRLVCHSLFYICTMGFGRWYIYFSQYDSSSTQS